MNQPPQPVITDMNARLVAAARALADATDAQQAARELRDELVRAAVDHGMSLRAVAKAVGVTSARVCAILAVPPADDDGA